MLVDGHEIESPLSRVRLWDELVDLDNIARWSALDACASTDSGHLEPSSSYLCTHHGDSVPNAASVEVVTYELYVCLVLRTCTTMADLDERLDLSDHLGGCLVTYSATATSAAFGPVATSWLVRHVDLVCSKLERFAGREVV